MYLFKLWKLRNLILEGKINVFKTLALSKIIFQAFVTPIPNCVVTELEEMQKVFYGRIQLQRLNKIQFVMITKMVGQKT